MQSWMTSWMTCKRGPRVTPRNSQLSCLVQGDLPVWSISIAVGAGSLGSEGELVCALFAVDCF